MYSPGYCRPPSPPPSSPPASKIHEQTLKLRGLSLLDLEWMKGRVAEILSEHKGRHKFDPLTRNPRPSVSDVVSSALPSPSSSMKDEGCSTPETFATDADRSEVSELFETVRALRAENERSEMLFAAERKALFQQSARLEAENERLKVVPKAESHKINSEDDDDSFESQTRRHSRAKKAAKPPVVERGYCSAENKGEDRQCLVGARREA
ncbi:hypothetical protein IWX90DRAFT_418148 [Phyllosticta citrichinensis]|uniref:Uncharacterized protein n=1 Tax=Phyllosticta citrichinensis TaxID=1130410 RepID=A0ABR1XI16_9PEZI